MNDIGYTVTQINNETVRYDTYMFNVTNDVTTRAEVLAEAKAKLGVDDLQIVNEIILANADVAADHSGPMVVYCEINGQRDARGIVRVNENNKGDAIGVAINLIKNSGGLTSAMVSPRYVVADEAA